ncbi:hypothetical protein H0G86_003885 [Trichoderma simmonsii]|uniref:Uncharacterized protein n=1 Tax=Trichoderma simmonsii TaxID=1491479 RepID=A0A8G0PCY1_9HYPO|nr:hypothetical protein H0G86_003885 [Trichoderma simmonsii]
MLLRGSDAGMASHRLRPRYVDSQQKMGLNFPLHPLLTIPCNHFFQYSHRFCPTTPLPESFVTHTRPLVQGVGSFGSAQMGLARRLRGKGLTMQGTSIGTGTLIDKSTYRIEKCHNWASISLALAPGALKFQKKVMWALGLAISLPSSLALIVWLLNWGLFSGLNYVIP